MPKYRALRAIKRPSADGRIRLMLYELFLGERFELEGKIHLSHSYYKKLELRCRIYEKLNFSLFQNTQNKARAALLCSVLNSLLLSRTNPLRQAELIAAARRDYAIGMAAQPARKDRFYAEGRIFAALPPTYGQNLGKSLLAFEILRKIDPSLTSPSYWMGKIYQEQGNEDKAIEAFERALADGDTRAVLRFPSKKFVRFYEHIDKPTFGVTPALFASPANGLGAGLLFIDDRLFDTFRGLKFLFLGNTRGMLSGHLALEDSHLSRWFRLKLDYKESLGTEDFFGLGVLSNVEDRSVLTTRRTEVEFKGEAFVLRPFFVTAGARYNLFHVRKVRGTSFNRVGIIDKTNSQHMGPFFRFGYDNRDSRQLTRRGIYSFFEGYFPLRGFGSKRSFERWTLYSELSIYLGLRHTLRFQGGVVIQNKEVPYGAFARLNGTIPIPGVRDNRFQDRNLAVASMEYRFRIFRMLSLFAFSSGGKVADQWIELFRSPGAAGMGGGLLLHLSTNRFPVFRLEVGRFQTENIVRVFGGLSF